MKTYQHFFAELKRRHVFRVAFIYGAVAFGLIQVADPLAKALLLPDTFLTYVAAILILGFPLALVLAWAFEVTPDGVRKARGATDTEIAAIVAQPASQRWPSGLLALAGIAALVAAAWWAGRTTGGAYVGADVSNAADVWYPDADGMSDDRPSIAVLPFEDMSPRRDQAYFSDGITEEILNTLAGVRELRVSARTSAFAFREAGLTAEQLGDTLRVRYLVEGSVRKAGDALRITAQLIDSRDGSHLWSEQFDREMRDVFAIQTEIARSIAEALRVPLGLEVDERLADPIADLEAYDLYLAGRAAMRERGGRLREALQLFEAALALDSTWAPVWAALAEAHELTVWYTGPLAGDEDVQEFISHALANAERAAHRALDLDPDNASALVALGSVERNRANWDEAQAHYTRALALDPDNAEAHQQYGEFLLNVGRIQESVEAFDRAASLDPAGIRYGMLGFGLLADDRVDQAIRAYELEARLAVDPGQRTMALWRLSHAYMRAGRWDEGAETLREANHADPASEPRVHATDIPALLEGLRAADASLIPSRARERLTIGLWSLAGEPDGAAERLVSVYEGAPFGRVAELWLPFLEPALEDARLQERLETRGLANAEARRTPAGERTVPAALRTRGEP